MPEDVIVDEGRVCPTCSLGGLDGQPVWQLIITDGGGTLCPNCGDTQTVGATYSGPNPPA